MVKKEVNWEQARLPEPPSEPPIMSKADPHSVLEEIPPPDRIPTALRRRFPSRLDPGVKPPWYVRQSLRELGE